MISPVRIGLVGGGPNERYHLERLALHGAIELVASWSPQPAPPVGPRAGDVHDRLEDLLARGDLDAVLIAAALPDRARLMAAALEAGRHAAVEPPPARTAEELRAVLRVAKAASRKGLVLPMRRREVDFLAAREAVAGGALGRVRSARLVSWGMAVPRPSRDSDDPCAADDSFLFDAYQYLDQLFALVDERPTSVWASIDRHGPRTAGSRFTLSVGFAVADAWIDVNLRSSAAVHSGWLLWGERAAYHRQRTFRSEAGGEIWDAPLAKDRTAEVERFDDYAELLSLAGGRSVSADAVDAEPPQDSLTAALWVLAVIDAARESSRSGLPVVPRLEGD
jgi:predicted dehydrogenase